MRVFLILLVSSPIISIAFTHRSPWGHENRSGSTKLFNDRRNFLNTISLGTIGAFLIDVEPSYAGEVGAKITKAVTQSDLGISVRRSVVKGAQIIDKIDGKWEKFSDDYGLGAERFKQQPRPRPKEIPDPLPINVEIAKKVLSLADEVFIETLGSPGINIDLPLQINKVDNLVRKSFERSGLNLDEGTELTAQRFNYYCYTHFKAMCDIVVENKLPFNRKQFENKLGEKLLPLFAPSSNELLASIPKQSSKECQAKAINVGLQITDQIIKNLVSNGFCSLAERNKVENEEGRIIDWIDDLSDLQLSIPLDGDITLNSQILIQEQGFRIYPGFGRFMITYALQKSLSGFKQSISSDEYFMDTNYSSDPDLFEVKQVLINIVIDSA
jgi:hypothetical protein